MINGVDYVADMGPGIPQAATVTYIDIMARMDQGLLNLVICGAVLVLAYTIHNIRFRDSARIPDEYRKHINGFMDAITLIITLFFAIVGVLYYS